MCSSLVPMTLSDWLLIFIEWTGHVTRPSGFQDGGRWFLSRKEKLTFILSFARFLCFLVLTSPLIWGVLFPQGTSAEQDNRFLDKQKKLLKSMRFDDVLNKKVSRCNLILSFSLFSTTSVYFNEQFIPNLRGTWKFVTRWLQIQY